MDKRGIMLYRKERGLAQFSWLAISLCLIVVVPGSAQSTSTPTQAPTSPPATATKAPVLPPLRTADCLACHGPYEKIVAASASYKTEKGESVNPHTTSDGTKLRPHASGKGVIDCSKCHRTHPLPFVSVKDVPTPNTNYCFLFCHHQDNFSPCSECHDAYKL